MVGRDDETHIIRENSTLSWNMTRGEGAVKGKMSGNAMIFCGNIRECPERGCAAIGRKKDGRIPGRAQDDVGRRAGEASVSGATSRSIVGIPCLACMDTPCRSFCRRAFAVCHILPSFDGCRSMRCPRPTPLHLVRASAQSSGLECRARRWDWQARVGVGWTWSRLTLSFPSCHETGARAI